MKISVSLLLPAVVAAAVLDARQEPQYKYTTKSLKPVLRPNSKRTVTRVGPLNLLPGVSRCNDYIQLFGTNGTFTDLWTTWIFIGLQWSGYHVWHS